MYFIGCLRFTGQNRIAQSCRTCHHRQQSRVLVRIRDCCLGGPKSAFINIRKKSPAYNDWLAKVSATLVPTLLPSRQGIRTNTLYPPRSLSSGCS